VCINNTQNGSHPEASPRSEDNMMEVEGHSQAMRALAAKRRRQKRKQQRMEANLSFVLISIVIMHIVCHTPRYQEKLRLTVSYSGKCLGFSWPWWQSVFCPIPSDVWWRKARFTCLQFGPSTERSFPLCSLWSICRVKDLHRLISVFKRSNVSLLRKLFDLLLRLEAFQEVVQASHSRMQRKRLVERE